LKLFQANNLELR
jgi:hypothetical protein